MQGQYIYLDPGCVPSFILAWLVADSNMLGGEKNVYWKWTPAAWPSGSSFISGELARSYDPQKATLDNNNTLLWFISIFFILVKIFSLCYFSRCVSPWIKAVKFVNLTSSDDDDRIFQNQWNFSKVNLTSFDNHDGIFWNWKNFSTIVCSPPKDFQQFFVSFLTINQNQKQEHWGLNQHLSELQHATLPLPHTHFVSKPLSVLKLALSAKSLPSPVQCFYLSVLCSPSSILCFSLSELSSPLSILCFFFISALFTSVNTVFSFVSTMFSFFNSVFFFVSTVFSSSVLCVDSRWSSGHSL